MDEFGQDLEGGMAEVPIYTIGASACSSMRRSLFFQHMNGLLEIYLDFLCPSVRMREDKRTMLEAEVEIGDIHHVMD